VGVALLLTGCGSARPGVAAQVGDETISLSDIDETAVLWCKAVEPELQGQVVPMRFVRAAVLGSMLERAVAEQIAEEYGVEPSESYRAAVAQQTQAAEVYPADTREALVEVSTSAAYRTSVLDAAATAALKADGIDSPTVDQVTQRGEDLFKTWPDSNEVVIDPRFDVRLADGSLTPAETTVSFGLSRAARDGVAEQPDPAYAQSLPDSQRCG
jgi:hypothetical protein